MLNPRQSLLMAAALLVASQTLASATTPTTPSASAATASGKSSSSATTIKIDKSDLIAKKEGAPRVGGVDITDKIKAELLSSANISSLSISVSTDKGVVTLSGSVENELQKNEVIKITSNVTGVKSVVDQMTINAI